ncbi:C4-dicarboxylate ABC transporter [Desulfuribacillus alkaliarsenatis]|uniref:C4-dicarboxylate ABC transporter n=1 Tax=Desulfuribacillus alkaliarsenatis TaxID=766136 RepID=A0A1E5G4K1_9FIRM|nr:C4-dicarboxylate ABC transporter [Desulfuribacillus alkaliarsenatis]
MIIKFSHVVAENTPKGLAAQKFKRLAEERTNGRVEVQVFANAQLYDDDAAVSALQQNHVQLIAPATSKMTALFPEWQVFDLPFAFADEESVRIAMEGELGELMFSLLESEYMYGLAMWDNGFKQLTNRSRVIRQPTDVSGLRFRVMDSRILEKQYAQLGAIPYISRFSDVYSLLEQQLVDGQENTLSNIYTKRFYEVQNYMTISNHGYLGYAVITNAEFWSSLPDDIRDVLDQAIAETTLWIRQNARTINDEQLENLIRTQRLRVHYLTESELIQWHNALQPIYDLLEQEIGKEYIEALQTSRK